MTGGPRVDEELFNFLKGGQELLDSVRRGVLSESFKQEVRNVLSRIPETLSAVGKRSRKEWRDIRIRVYNNLLLVALGPEGQEILKESPAAAAASATNAARERQKLESRRAAATPAVAGSKLELESPAAAAASAVRRRAILMLKPGTIYTYLLDQIHQDEEIMLKYYRSDERSLRGKVSKSNDPSKKEIRAFWLRGSIRIYRDGLVLSVVEALTEWDDENKDLRQSHLLSDAKQKFLDTVSSLGKPWEGRGWRNRARLYWLLGVARHAPISKGKLGNFKNSAYNGPFHRLVQEMISKDEKMLQEIERDDNHSSGFIKKLINKNSVKLEKDLVPPDFFEECSLLDWAVMVNDQDLVKFVLKYKKKHLKKSESDWYSEDSWGKSWANALWIAAYKGHAEIVKELLSCQFPAKFPYYRQYTEHYSEESIQPPLHVAVRRGHVSVVEVFCTELVTKNFGLHKGDYEFNQTPLEFATDLKDASTKRRIQSILLEVGEVQQAVDELRLQRDLTVGSTNAIMVGAALIAGVAYGGWLQPPLGYQTYYQFTEPLPAPPDTFQSYAGVQGHPTIKVFAFSNALSFFLAIVAVLAGMDTACCIEVIEEMYMAKKVAGLRYKLKRTTIFFFSSLVCVLIAFASSAIAILPPMTYYRSWMYALIALGGILCLMYITKMFLFFVSKRLHQRTASHVSRMRERVGRVFTQRRANSSKVKRAHDVDEG